MLGLAADGEEVAYELAADAGTSSSTQLHSPASQLASSPAAHATQMPAATLSTLPPAEPPIATPASKRARLQPGNAAPSSKLQPGTQLTAANTPTAAAAAAPHPPQPPPQPGSQHALPHLAATPNSKHHSTGQNTHHATAPPPAPAPAPAEAPPPETASQLFSGCRLVFWQRSHTSRLAAKVRELGGEVQAEVGPGTTHIIARWGDSMCSGTSSLMACAADARHATCRCQRLGSDGQCLSAQMQLLQPCMHTARTMCQPPTSLPVHTHHEPPYSEYRSIGPCMQLWHQHARAHLPHYQVGSYCPRAADCTCSAPHHRYDTKPEAAQQQLQAAAVTLSYSNRDTASGSSHRTTLPNTIHFVTPEWVSSCITRAQLLPEAPYHIYLHKFQPLPGGAAGAAGGAGLLGSAEVDGPLLLELGVGGGAAGGVPAGAAGAARGAAVAEAEAPAGAGAGDVLHAQQELLLVPAGQRNDTSQQQLDDRQQHSAACSHAAAVQQAGPGTGPAAAVTAPAPAEAAAALPAVMHASGKVLPRPEDVCGPGEPWGAGGRWIERWDDGLAVETVNRLVSHWHKHQYQVGAGWCVCASGEGGRGEGDMQQGEVYAAVDDTVAVPAPRHPLSHPPPAADLLICTPTSACCLELLPLSNGSRQMYCTHMTPSCLAPLQTSLCRSSVDSKDSSGAAGQQEEVQQPLATAAAGAAAAGAAAGPSNGLCPHVACSRQAFCLVAEMQRMRSNYSAGRNDQFRIKAADRAIRALETLQAPLTTAQVGGRVVGRPPGGRAGGQQLLCVCSPSCMHAMQCQNQPLGSRFAKLTALTLP